MITNDTQAPYHRMPGKRPPHWMLVAITIAIGLQLLWFIVRAINTTS